MPINDEYLKEIYDRLFQIRNNMDKQLRHLKDMQGVMNVLEYGFESIGESNSDYEVSIVRIMLSYLRELEGNISTNAEQIGLIEKEVGES